MATQQVVIVNFQDCAGNPLANGTVTFRLTTDVSSAVSGGPNVCAGQLVSNTLDSTGSVAETLWTGTYFVTAYTAQGLSAWSGQLIVAAGGADYLLLEDGSVIWLESGAPDAILLET